MSEPYVCRKDDCYYCYYLQIKPVVKQEPSPKNRLRGWTYEKELFLMINYNKMSYKTLSKMLSRSPSALWVRSRKLGLKRKILVFD